VEKGEGKQEERKTERERERRGREREKEREREGDLSRDSIQKWLVTQRDPIRLTHMIPEA
jgi:hypothetical protein